MRIDLHIHSNASDGELRPDAVARTARNAGLDIIALTDHDTIQGIESAQDEAKKNKETPRPTIIPGIEVSSTHDGRGLHILGYFIETENQALQRYDTTAKRNRVERMQAMIEKLAALEIHVTLEDVIQNAGPQTASIGRPHLARTLVEKGHVASVNEAFRRYLANDGPAHVPTELLSTREAIELIHEANGIAVWAHPPQPTFDEEIQTLIDWGLDGIECYRPYNTPAETKHLRDTAHAHGLCTTGGSDWHGHWNGPLGSFHISEKEVDSLLERADF